MPHLKNDASYVMSQVQRFLDLDWIERHRQFEALRAKRPWAAARVELCLPPDLLLTGLNTGYEPLPFFPISLPDRRKRQTTLHEYFQKRPRNMH